MPAKYPPMSLLMVNKMNTTTRQGPLSVARVSIKKPAMNGRYVMTKNEAVMSRTYPSTPRRIRHSIAARSSAPVATSCQIGP